MQEHEQSILRAGAHLAPRSMVTSPEPISMKVFKTRQP